jgi:hypothetical protein
VTATRQPAAGGVTSAENAKNAAADVVASERATATAVSSISLGSFIGLTGVVVYRSSFGVDIFTEAFFTEAFFTDFFTAFLAQALFASFFLVVTTLLATGFAFETTGVIATARATELVAFFVFFLPPFSSTSKSN